MQRFDSYCLETDKWEDLEWDGKILQWIKYRSWMEVPRDRGYTVGPWY